MKIKIRLQQEAIVCGYTEPRASRTNFGSLVLGVYENDELVYIGLAGGGFDESGLKVDARPAATAGSAAFALQAAGENGYAGQMGAAGRGLHFQSARCMCYT